MNLVLCFLLFKLAIVTIKTKSGVYTERVDFPKGEPENPMTNEEFRSRYDSLMEYAGISETVSADVFDIVYRKNTIVHELIKKL